MRTGENAVRNHNFRIAGLGVLLVGLSTTLCLASTSLKAERSVLLEREHEVSRTLSRASQFADVPHVNWRSCEQEQAPVALATPDPLLTPAGRGRKVRVSFMIGTDGRVHSPLILESAGIVGDRRVLDTVRRWRYRPGTCNGVPTETEGKIEFSIR